MKRIGEIATTHFSPNTIYSHKNKFIRLTQQSPQGIIFREDDIQTLNTPYLSGSSDLFDGVYSHDSDSVARHYFLTQIPVTVELQVTGEFTVRDGFWRFLELQYLKIYAFTLVRDNEIGVKRAFRLTTSSRSEKGRFIMYLQLSSMNFILSQL